MSLQELLQEELWENQSELVPSVLEAFLLPC